jgi:hypothetical protein
VPVASSTTPVRRSRPNSRPTTAPAPGVEREAIGGATAPSGGVGVDGAEHAALEEARDEPVQAGRVHAGGVAQRAAGGGAVALDEAEDLHLFRALRREKRSPPSGRAHLRSPGCCRSRGSS